MQTNLAEKWRSAFLQVVQQPTHAQALQTAGEQKQLKEWTTALTAVVVSACQTLGWQASAKGYSLELLPVPTNEFLTMDVMAFAGAAERWQFPIAVIELENNWERSAYSLWKVLCVRVALRVVFCYCKTAGERRELINYLEREILQPILPRERLNLQGETLVVIGSRDAALTFPYDFFKWWLMEVNIGKFTLF